ncbi:hypothetical protein ADK59_35210 [Streptomyces sp. XY332]|nr:hypothetical protein ADK59_35210 [Streptomyces sp. XY332]
MSAALGIVQVQRHGQRVHGGGAVGTQLVQDVCRGGVGSAPVAVCSAVIRLANRRGSAHRPVAAFELGLWAAPAGRGMFGFTWHPTAKDEEGRPIRVGGNWPILVDQDTGSCRLVQGPNEFSALRGT